ncbi:LacI family DNA-binding transcriptional regulator [Pelagibacterium limicola]|uniref:LacI family DNA-binding transcriptional regulator n=1 Tax=Pelagibacterium limicola TaxID=2791022 RepID=UPI001FE28DEA|nr:LacI family DNA-binding transcriptional regulator [Pelagibacterium limicola]
MSRSKNRGGSGRPTMVDVAVKAGVSQATVSLVLNGSPGATLTSATRRRVYEAAEEVGYRFVRRNSQKSTDPHSVIVFIADELTADPWVALAYEGAREKASQLGVDICLEVSNGDPDVEAAIVERMRRLTVRGFIYASIVTRAIEVPPALRGQRVVLVNGYDAKRAFASVLPANLLGARAATERLLAAGCRRIGFINGQQGVESSRDRLRGYRQALASNDIPYDADLVRPGSFQPPSGYEQTHELMSLASPPDAIFCANDLMAIGCLEALKELHISVPGDIPVIGFDDREIAQYTRPPLTTMRLPQRQMGEIAAELLLDGTTDLDPRLNQIKVECELVERDSVPRPERQTVQSESVIRALVQS